MSQDQPQSPRAYLWGAKAIADYIGRTERQAYYLIETNRLRVTRLGPKMIVADPAEIDADLKSGA
jgi:hypothetical protein